MRCSSATVFWVVSATLLICGLLSAAPAVPRALQSELPLNLDGKATDPFKLADGRLTVLLFVRTDCPISNRYAPAIQKLSEEFHDSADFWLVYPDAGESAERIRAHLAQFHYSIPALRDIHRGLVNRAKATITPETAVFDPLGKLVYHGRIDNWYEDFGRARRPQPLMNSKTRSETRSTAKRQHRITQMLSAATYPTSNDFDRSTVRPTFQHYAHSAFLWPGLIRPRKINRTQTNSADYLLSRYRSRCFPLMRSVSSFR